jgi:EpsD family peptidyl-prolyl cis-trans isomerase
MNALLCAVMLLPLAGAAGCGRADGAAGHGVAAARVNGAEITLEEVRGNGTGAGAAQALEKVIERELLVQQALQARLDEDPEVAHAMESARREALARAWLERAAAGARATPEEIAAFYGENPALFAERRIYKLKEMTVAGAQDKLDLLRSEVASARDLEEVAGWLRWRNLNVSPVSTATQPAENLPLAYLPQLSRMKEGEIAVLPSLLGAAIVQLVQAQDAPLSAREAEPVIGRLLSARKRLALAQDEVKRLRAQASIEYLGEFRPQAGFAANGGFTR